MELCYISSVGKCFIPEINGQFARCNSTFNLLVAGQMITVSFYEIIIGTGIGKSVVHMEVSSSDMHVHAMLCVDKFLHGTRDLLQIHSTAFYSVIVMVLLLI